MGSRHRSGVGAAVVVALNILLTPVATAQPDVTSASVETAIQRGTRWLWAQRNAVGHWEARDDRDARHWAGSTALVSLSLLYAGENPREQRLQTVLEWLANAQLNGTYTYGVRAHVMALAARRAPDVKLYRERLRADLDWLLDAVWDTNTAHSGAYDYTPAPAGRTSGRWDNSVTQYGVLGVWMAAEAGLEVPEKYWRSVGGHWLRTQNHDGGWGYQHTTSSTGSMTVAGLASLYVVVDQLYAGQRENARPYLAGIRTGLDWMGREYAIENPRGNPGHQYYYLYGVERVGHASGYKYMRDRDWFRDGAQYLLKHQQKDGSWAGSASEIDDARNTAFALLFLAHGRAPLLFNKLKHGDDWNLVARDVAGLTRYAEHTLERFLNWQVVELDSTLTDLLDAPVLYFYGKTPVQFSDEQALRLRDYCLNGGLFFVVAGGDSREFRQQIQSVAKRAFPEYPLRPVRENHPLVSGDVQFVIDDPPALLEVHNGVRTLMLISARDLAIDWPRRGRDVEQSLQLACNVFLHATDKVTSRSRLNSPLIPIVPRDIRRTIHVARIRYDGAWNPEPYGWNRLVNYMHNETATRLLVSSGITFDDPDMETYRIAHITGTGTFQLDEAEKAGLRRFLARGGTLLADAAGGAHAFTDALEAHVRDATQLESGPLAAESFLYSGAGIEDAMPLSDTAYRRAARRAARGRDRPHLHAFAARRRLPAIYSQLDLSTGLLGTQVYDVWGYAPRDALRITRNLLLYANLTSAEKAELHRAEFMPE